MRIPRTLDANKLKEQRDYHKRQIWEALREIMRKDGEYSLDVEYLARLASLPKSSFYKCVKADFEDCESLPAEAFKRLSELLAEQDGIYSLAYIGLPASAHIEIDDKQPAFQPNGLQDEIEDAVEMAHRLVEAKRHNDVTHIDAALSTLEDLLIRLTHERSKILNDAQLANKPIPCGDGAGLHL